MSSIGHLSVDKTYEHFLVYLSLAVKSTGFERYDSVDCAYELIHFFYLCNISCSNDITTYVVVTYLHEGTPFVRIGNDMSEDTLS